MLNEQQKKIISLLVTCEEENLELAKKIAQDAKIDLVKMLELEGFFELGFTSPDDFWNPDYCEGIFVNHSISNLRAIKYFPNLSELNFYDKISLCAGYFTHTHWQVRRCAGFCAAR